MLVEGETDEAVAVLVGRLQQALTQPLLAVGEEVILSVCIGAAVVITLVARKPCLEHRPREGQQ